MIRIDWNEVKKKTREFWSEYRRFKIGLIGIGLLIVLIFMAVIPSFIFPPETYYNWNNYPGWEYNPRLAPPEWVNWFSAKKYTPPETIKPLKVEGLWQFYAEAYIKLNNITDKNLIKQVYEVFKQQMAGKGYVYFYKYDFKWDIPSNDLIIIVSNVSTTIRLTLGIQRPTTLYNGQTVNVSFYPAFITTVTPTNRSILIHLENSEQLMQVIVKNYISKYENPTILKNATENNILTATVLSPVTLLFYAPGPGMIYGQQGIDKGTYRFNITVEAVNGSLEHPPNIEVRVPGSCYGLLGTDFRGRDIFVGILWGSRVALMIGITYAVAVVLIGLIYGVVSAYAGGLVDEVMQRINEVLYSIPLLPFLILFAYTIRQLYGTLSVWHIIGVLIIFAWTGLAIVVRSMALQIKEQPFVEAARAIGASSRRIVFKHILPQLMPYAFASMALAVPGAILIEAGLSFLGLSDPNIPTWGKMIYEAQNSLSSWWWVLSPGLMIAVTGMAFVFIGNALDTILNPRLRRL